MHVQVGIIGAGPAGLLLSHLLAQAGIESVILESRSRSYVEQRIRAGVLEQGTVDLLNETGVGERMRREGLLHHGIELRFLGESHRIDITALTGRGITVYGQHEVVKDLVAARLAAGGQIVFEAEATKIEGIETTRPMVHYRHADADHVLSCDVLVGCDGFHGIARAALPAGVMRGYDRVYPFAWLGILADAAPAQDELIYANHENGFALFSMRSPTVSRLYLQVPPDEDIAGWSDDRIWGELKLRLGAHEGVRVNDGPITQKGITAMRSFVTEPMRHGRLFLAGDSAHIVPPTGAKGMNLAVADVYVLSRALRAFYASGSTALFDSYTQTCLKRVWRAQHFSWWMTSMLHRLPGASAFDHRRQLAELDAITSSRAGQTFLAENYAGLPFSD